MSRIAWRPILKRELPQLARIVLVGAVAWQICVMLGAVQPPVFAVIVPLVSMRDDAFSALNLSVARLVGVVAGLGIAVAVLQLLQPSTLAISAVLALALLAGIILRVGNVLNNQVAVSALMVFSSVGPSQYALARLWETGIGTAATLAMAPLLFPGNPLVLARAELGVVAANMAASMRSAAAAVDAPIQASARISTLLLVTEQLAAAQGSLQSLSKQIASARKSLPWTVVRRRAMQAAAALGPTVRLAERQVRHLEDFAAEIITFSGRPDFGSDHTLSEAHLQILIGPLGTCVEAALSGRSFHDDLERARAAVIQFRHEDHSRVASVVRRPLHRMVEDLAAFVAAER